MAILNASAVGHRKELGSFSLVERAKEHIERVSRSRGREIVIASHLEDELKPIDFAPAISGLSQGIDANTVGAALKKMALAYDQKLLALQAAMFEAAQAADEVFARQDQELQMHWWLTGARSQHLDMPFQSIDNLQKPLVLANELNAMTRGPLGPVSIRALLERAGIKAEPTVNVPQTVAACGPELLKWLMPNGQASPMTTPIHFAIQRQIEVGKGDEWVAAWSKITELDQDWPISPIDLAVQFYREKQLLKLAG